MKNMERFFTKATSSMQSTCDMDGQFFPSLSNVLAVLRFLQHSLDCKLGGYRSLQHNEVRDLFAECLREAKFHAVETEPTLQPLSGEAFKFKSSNKDARSDVKCWDFGEKCDRHTLK